MLRYPTTFIVGAGASVEANMPTAMGLAAAIARDSRTHTDNRSGNRLYLADKNWEDELHRHYFGKQSDAHPAFEALGRIGRGLLPTSSIDAFIDQHRSDGLIGEMGKVQIARHIIRAEAGSKLYQRGFPQKQLQVAEALSGTWYLPFWSGLSASVGADELELIGRNLTIVSFNYDRCLEVALIECLRANYDVPYTKAFEIVGNLRIFHPYGSLGYLSAAPEFGGVNFGDVTADPWAMATNLRTFMEGASDRSQMEEVHRAISEAHALVFLGFSFHSMNMQLLTPSVSAGGAKQVYSTGKGIKSSAVPEIKQKIYKMYGGHPHAIIQDNYWHIEVGETCTEFFETHGASLF